MRIPWSSVPRKWLGFRRVKGLIRRVWRAVFTDSIQISRLYCPTDNADEFTWWVWRLDAPAPLALSDSQCPMCRSCKMGKRIKCGAVMSCCCCREWNLWLKGLLLLGFWRCSLLWCLKSTIAPLSIYLIVYCWDLVLSCIKLLWAVAFNSLFLVAS